MATLSKVIISDSLKFLVQGRILAGYFHTNNQKMAGANWREKHGQSRTGTSYGPLTDMPDWSYVDGRPSPALSKRQAKRKAKTSKINERVKMLLKEVDLTKLQSDKIAGEQEMNSEENNSDTPQEESDKEEEMEVINNNNNNNNDESLK